MCVDTNKLGIATMEIIFFSKKKNIKYLDEKL